MNPARRAARVALVAACVLAFGGCDTRSDAERINEAVPPGKAAARARSELLALAGDDAAGEALRAQVAARIEARALECAKDYSPDLFAETAQVARELEDAKDCFRQHDKDFVAWVAQHRAAAQLGGGPLRPVPKVFKPFTAPAKVEEIYFAAEAGVALVTNQGDTWAIDLNDGSVISKSRTGHTASFSNVTSISPNGRLYAANDEEGGFLREVESGKTILAFKGNAALLRWVGDRGVLLLERDRRTKEDFQWVFRDLATGLESPLELSGYHHLLPVPGEHDRFHFVAENSAAELRFEKTPEGWKAILGKRLPGRPVGNDPEDNLTADGRGLLRTDGVANELEVIDLATLASKRVSLAPFSPMRAWSTRDPDQVLILGSFRNARGAPSNFWMRYSLSRGAAAYAGPAPEFLAGFGGVEYMAALHQAVVLDSATVRPVDPAATEPFRAVDSVAAVMEQVAIDSITTALERQRMDGAFAHLQAPRATPDEAPVDAKVLALGGKSRVLGIGVYDGTREPGEPLTANNYGGTVRVRVMRTQGPAILVLASNDPVRWILTVDAEADVGAILVSNRKGAQSQVLGALAPVHHLGSAWVANDSATGRDQLEVQVRRWTGKGFDRFQNKHDGDQFIIRE